MFLLPITLYGKETMPKKHLEPGRADSTEWQWIMTEVSLIHDFSWQITAMQPYLPQGEECSSISSD